MSAARRRRILDMAAAGLEDSEISLRLCLGWAAVREVLDESQDARGRPSLPKCLDAVVAAIGRLDAGAGVSCADLRAALSVPSTALYQRIQRLRDLGMIAGRGKTNRRRYRLVQAPARAPEPPPPSRPAPPAPPARDCNRPKPQAEASQRKPRRCLGPDCGDTFMSAWAGNRLCPACTARVNKTNGGIAA